MELRIEDHAIERAEERGASLTEIQDTLERGQASRAKGNRFAKSLVFPYESDWRGKYYEQKHVQVIYVVEGDVAIAVTVYVYYGQWE